LRGVLSVKCVDDDDKDDDTKHLKIKVVRKCEDNKLQIKENCNTPILYMSVSMRRRRRRRRRRRQDGRRRKEGGRKRRGAERERSRD
jgi:hypothetical protein